VSECPYCGRPVGDEGEVCKRCVAELDALAPPATIALPRADLERIRKALRFVRARLGGGYGAMAECQDAITEPLTLLDSHLKGGGE
jgi:hypothetical protein